MSRLIDRIVERSPELIDRLLGGPAAAGRPVPPPRVLVVDSAPPGPNNTSAPAARNCLPRWPLTFIEIEQAPGLPNNLSAPIITGWMLVRKGSGGSRRLRASLVLEVGTTIAGPAAVLGLKFNGGGELTERPEFVSLAGSPEPAERRSQEDRVLAELQPALVAISRVNAKGARVRVHIPSDGENAARMARGLLPLFPYTRLSPSPH